MEDDRTLVPMRFLFEQMGAEVTWDEEIHSLRLLPFRSLRNKRFALSDLRRKKV